MSWVANVILVTFVKEESALMQVNKFIDGYYAANRGPDEPSWGFVSVDDSSLPAKWYGGTKMLETCIYVAAFNHFDIPQLIAGIRKVNFRRPEFAQLFIKDQEDYKFRTIELFPDKQAEYEKEAGPFGDAWWEKG